jgi:hypothetical protein
MLFDRVLGTRVIALAGQATGRWPARLRSFATFVLLACLVGLSALAHASPPDPLWLPGIYDGADDDDAVALLTDTSVVDDSRRLAGPPFVEFRSMRVSSPSARADRLLLGSHLRSPPIS